MALQSIRGLAWVPHFAWASTSAPAFNVVAIDASTDQVALICRATAAIVISKIAVGFGSITTSANLDFRIETVGTTGAATPTGSLWAANTASTGVTPAANTVVEGTLTANATITRGEVFAVVVQETGGGGAISLNVNRLDGAATNGGFEFPYGSFNTTGTYANSNVIPCFAVHDNTSGTWYYIDDGVLPWQSFASTALNTGTSATTGTRRGVRFQLPFPATLSAVRYKGSTTTTTGDFTINLYDDSGGALVTLATIDANQRRASAGAGTWDIYFDSDYDLAANTWYRLVLVPTTANSCSIYEATMNAAAYQDAMSLGQNFFVTAFISSAWVDTNTDKRPLMALGLSALDDGVQTGGGGNSPISWW
jgi:hypothetical protein